MASKSSAKTLKAVPDAPKPLPLEAPERAIVLNGTPMKLRSDFRAMYVFEELTGTNLFEVVQTESQSKIYTTVARLLYALTATDRKKRDEETSFDEFMDALPPADPQNFAKLAEAAFGTLQFANAQQAAVSGNAGTAEQ